MARTRLTHEARKAKTREALIAAATKLFAARGVEATSLDQVAESAGFTKGAIYANFPNKKALIDAAVERHAVWLDPSPLLQADLSLADRLAIMGREVAELATTLPRETVLLDLEYRLYLMRNPKEALPNLAEANKWKDFPQRFEALNAAQQARPPFATAEMLLLASILARGILRGFAETPGALTPGAIETAFRLLAGKGADSIPGSTPRPPAPTRKRA